MVQIEPHISNTNRDILSTIVRIYCPLDLGPVVAKAKIFFQKLWLLKLDWIVLLSETINKEWRQFVESLQIINSISIERCIVTEQSKMIELREFSDAPESAFGAVSTANV
ncbi:uncharacterized protein NPIL_473791 [Nephila pilipes]|uniref:Uncharacterized protein n=1 Tax=Nephila pilipes TaxID=299642 RepID=A0A8X6MRQ8_NEPPI|nr:uncharacterized protein NPIL_473791 [Nephila pilipes]